MSSGFDLPIVGRNTADEAKEWFNDLPLPGHPDYVHFMDDFLRVAFDDATAGDRTRWTQINDTGASLGIEADTRGGWATLNSQATTDNNGCSIQGNEIWAVAADKYLHVEAKLKFHDADDCDFFFGLSENFATNPEAVLSAANRIGFQVDEGNASILCKTESGGTETSTDSGVDAADDTEVTLGIRCHGTGLVEFYVNRTKVATHASNIPTANMALALAHLSGSATGTFIMEVDYIAAAMER